MGCVSEEPMACGSSMPVTALTLHGGRVIPSSSSVIATRMVLYQTVSNLPQVERVRGRSKAEAKRRKDGILERIGY